MFLTFYSSDDVCRWLPRAAEGTSRVYFLLFFFCSNEKKKIVFCVSEKEIDKSEREVCARERELRMIKKGERKSEWERESSLRSISVALHLMNGTFFSGFLKAFQAKLHSDVSDYSVRILIVIFFLSFLSHLIFARNNQKKY